MPPLKVAYILLYFPTRTETFIAEEIRSIGLRNIDVQIISLLTPEPGLTQPCLQQLLERTWYAPDLLVPAIWKAQLHFLIKANRLYLRLLIKFLSQPYPRKPAALFLKRLVTFLKAVAVAHYLQKSGIELLHAHFAWLSGGAAWICARLLDKPFTVTVHAYDIYSFKNDLLHLISREAAHIISISEFNRSQIMALGTCNKEAVSVIHCGIDLSKFDNPSRRQVERSITCRIRILSVGSLVAKKGHSILIAACHILKERGLDFACTIIGGGRDESILLQQIRAYGLQRRVKLLGECLQPQVMEAYRTHDIFVLASIVASDGDRDGIPVVLMEAGMQGLPLVSTPVSGIPELVRHQQTGWLVPPSDPLALAEALVTLAENPGLRARLGQNARSLVQGRFDIESSTSDLAILFQKVSQKMGTQAQHGLKGKAKCSDR